jgi:hypothetical protein
MWHAWKNEKCVRLENLQQKDHVEELAVGERIIFKCMFEECGVGVSHLV